MLREEHYLSMLHSVQTEKRRLDHIISSINEVVWSCSADTFETIYINNACFDIYGYTPEEIIGDGDLLFGRVYPDDKKQFRVSWRELLRYNKSVLQYRIVHKDGSIKYIKNEVVLRRDSNNVPRFINGFARDVTLQTIQMERIIKQNQQLKEIAWIQSHKVRGPLATILGLIDLFDIGHASPENAEIITYLRTAADQLDAVVHDIVEKANAV